MKTHWKKLQNYDYLGAYSLTNGEDMTVTIESVSKEIVKGDKGKEEECTVAKIKGDKPMILNRTNCKMIQKIYGTPYIEEWAGKKITLYVAKIKAFGEDNLECLRIRPSAPQLPELKQGDKNWDKCVKALQGNYTIEQIEQKYFITPENREQLLSESI